MLQLQQSTKQDLPPVLFDTHNGGSFAGMRVFSENCRICKLFCFILLNSVQMTDIKYLLSHNY